MTNLYKIIAVLTAFFLILSIESSLVYSYLNKPTEINIPINMGKKISTKLIAEAYDSNGNLKQKVEKDNDLIMNNFRNFLIYSLFYPYYDVLSPTFSLYDTTNTSKTLISKCWQSSSLDYQYRWVDSASGSDPKGGYIGIGDGTTAPTVIDYDLESIVGSKTAVTGAYPTWNSGTGDITIVSTIPITGSYNITEGALFTRWLTQASATTYYFMITRDTFDAIAVENGDTFVLTIILNLSGEFTNNMGNFLASVFKYVADGNNIQFSCTRNDGATVSTMYCYTSAGSRSYAVHEYTRYSTTKSSWVRMGASGNAVSRTSYTLSNPLEVGVPPDSPYPTISSDDIVISVDIYCNEDVSIREVGFYTEWDFTEANSYLLFREVISTVNISAGRSARIICTITL